MTVGRLLGPAAVLVSVVGWALAQAPTAAAAAPAKKLVLEGAVTEIALVHDSDPSQGNLVGRFRRVTVRVDAVVAGSYTKPTFRFHNHGPVGAGLTVGRRCRIEAIWDGYDYQVDRTTPLPTKPSGGPPGTAVGSPLPKPIRNSKCPDSEVRAGPQTKLPEPPGVGWAVPVRLCAFREGFRLCNPSMEPAGMTGFWQVSPAQVADIDRALITFLRQQKNRRTDLERYARQYLGFFRGPRRYVFINAVPHVTVPDEFETHVIAACDDTWGIEYDVAAREFANLGIDSGPRPR